MWFCQLKDDYKCSGQMSHGCRRYFFDLNESRRDIGATLWSSNKDASQTVERKHFLYTFPMCPDTGWMSALTSLISAEVVEKCISRPVFVAIMKRDVWFFVPVVLTGFEKSNKVGKVETKVTQR